MQSLHNFSTLLNFLSDAENIISNDIGKSIHKHFNDQLVDNNCFLPVLSVSM